MNNALKYVKFLEGAGISREQAEAHIHVISDFLEADLATKQDINNLDIKLSQDIKNLDTKLSKEIKDLDIKLSKEIKDLDIKLSKEIKDLDVKFESIEHKILQSEYRMTIKLGSIVTVSIAAMAAVIKLF